MCSRTLSLTHLCNFLWVRKWKLPGRHLKFRAIYQRTWHQPAVRNCPIWRSLCCLHFLAALNLALAGAQPCSCRGARRQIHHYLLLSLSLSRTLNARSNKQSAANFREGVNGSDLKQRSMAVTFEQDRATPPPRFTPSTTNQHHYRHHCTNSPPRVHDQLHIRHTTNKSSRIV